MSQLSMDLITELDAVPGMEGYWSSEDGILIRLEMLGEAVVYGTYNHAVQISANAFGITHLQIAGPAGGPICDWCEEYLDRLYRVGQFMPELPHHPRCRHFWDVYIP
jgi:hypothetical protein